MKNKNVIVRIDDRLAPTFLNILLNLIFLNAVQSTHNAFAIDRSIAIDVMGTSGLKHIKQGHHILYFYKFK